MIKLGICDKEKNQTGILVFLRDLRVCSLTDIENRQGEDDSSNTGKVEISNRSLDIRISNPMERFSPKSKFYHEYEGDHLKRKKDLM